MSIRAQVYLMWTAYCCLNVYSVAHAKSVYAISRHSNSTVKAFHISENGLLEEQHSGLLPNNGSGAIDLAVNDKDNILFSSYDGANVIEAISTKTMERVATEMMSGGTDNEIAGLDYCHTYNLLLAAERYDNCIRVLEYDPIEAVFTKNDEKQMPEVTSGGILGICLDEVEMRLYISQSEASNLVRYYDFEVDGDQITIEHAGDISIKLDGQNKIAVGIAVYNDGAGTKYLYSSGYNHENPQEHPYLIRTTLWGENNQVIDRIGIEVGPSTYVAGVDTDNETGYLYLTTIGSSSSIRVYDPNQWTSDPNDCNYIQIVKGENISGPAGIAVGPNFFDPDRLWIKKEQISPHPSACINPDDPNALVTYKTSFHQSWKEEFNVVLREFLPEESIFESADPSTGSYDPLTHVYTWDVGYLPGWDPNSPGDPNMYYEITVYVTDTAEPSGYVLNVAEVESDNAYAKAQVQTSICCWTNDNIIYVDREATGHNSGVDWANAYVNLQDALDRAGMGCGGEIWVAGGLYSPGNATTDRFEVPDDIAMYGGFEGTETVRERNWATHQSILSGYIDKDIFGNDVQNDTIIAMGNNSLLDGFTIEAGELYGTWGKDVDYTVRNCLLLDNDQTGIYSENGDLTVEWCEIKNNGTEGIYHIGDCNSIALITNSKIYNNLMDGIYADSSTVHIMNSLIYQNGLADDAVNSFYGISLLETGPDSLIRNNTIVSNIDSGINVVGDNLPEIRNCIIWNNGDKQLEGFDADSAAFNSCIQDSNDIPERYIISTDPNFAYDPFGTGNTNFHLAYNSRCVDAGDGVTDANEFDIDGETRVFGDAVDIGADEAVACDCDGVLTADDIYNPMDFNANGIINNHEFKGFAETWLCRDPNDPSIVTDPNSTSDPNYVGPAVISHWRQCWNPVYNIDTTFPSTYIIDLADVELFWNDYWLWMACWKENEFIGLYQLLPSSL